MNLEQQKVDAKRDVHIRFEAYVKEVLQVVSTVYSATNIVVESEARTYLSRITILDPTPTPDPYSMITAEATVRGQTTKDFSNYIVAVANVNKPKVGTARGRLKLAVDAIDAAGDMTTINSILDNLTFL